jgi:hypothetical protein
MKKQRNREAFVNRAQSSALSDEAPRPSRKAVVVGIMGAIALIHILRVGSYLHGSLFRLYCGYFSDFIVPFGLYFLVCLSDNRVPLLAVDVRSVSVKGDSKCPQDRRFFSLEAQDAPGGAFLSNFWSAVSACAPLCGPPVDSRKGLRMIRD